MPTETEKPANSPLGSLTGSQPIYPQSVECHDGISRWIQNEGGMTLRQHYAGLALTSLVADGNLSPQIAAKVAVEYAEALCSALAENVERDRVVSEERANGVDHRDWFTSQMAKDCIRQIVNLSVLIRTITKGDGSVKDIPSYREAQDLLSRFREEVAQPTTDNKALRESD